METKRIITRPDFDGVVCAVLLKDALGIQAPVYWVEPAEMQKGQASVNAGDVIANLPYDSRCSLWFDHHFTNRVEEKIPGSFALTPSAARVIFDFYAGRFSRDFSGLVDQTDRIDSADLTEDEVLYPERFPHVLLSMTVKNPDREPAYWNLLVGLLLTRTVEEAMEEPEVKKRCRNAVEQNRRYRKLLEAHTEVRGQVSITDFRSFEKTPVGNRFLVFSLFPEAVVNVKIHCHDLQRDKVVLHLGHSIFNRNCRVNVGLLLSHFEGGGHRGAGAATFHRNKAEHYIPNIISALEKNEPNEDAGV
ncbi:MAG: exopolyphosphatase [Desulfobacterales bacterium]|jgi:hypothetical protein